MLEKISAPPITASAKSSTSRKVQSPGIAAVRYVSITPLNSTTFRRPLTEMEDAHAAVLEER